MQNFRIFPIEMKTKFRLKSLWNLSAAYSLLFLLLHTTEHARCRPQDSNITHQWQRTDKVERRLFDPLKVKRSAELRTGEHERTLKFPSKLVDLDAREPDAMHHKVHERFFVEHDKTMKLPELDVGELDIGHHGDHERFVSFLADDAVTQNDGHRLITSDDVDYTSDIVIEGTDLVYVDGDVDHLMMNPDVTTKRSVIRSYDKIIVPSPDSGKRHLADVLTLPSVRHFGASRMSSADMMSTSKSLKRKKRVLSSAPDVEVQTRRQGKGSRRHRLRHRRKHRQRLLLKTKNGKNHDSNRKKFPLRSDSPSYLITSANEVKKDWCKTIPLKQKITEPNCKPKEIMNNFCYGQCNSFFIPHPGRTAVGGGYPAVNRVAFQSCPYCRPHRFKWVDVVLNCSGQNPPRVSKHVFVVESCRCSPEVLQ